MEKLMQISVQPLEEIPGVVPSLLRFLPVHYAKFTRPWGKYHFSLECGIVHTHCPNFVEGEGTTRKIASVKKQNLTE